MSRLPIIASWTLFAISAVATAQVESSAEADGTSPNAVIWIDDHTQHVPDPAADKDPVRTGLKRVDPQLEELPPVVSSWTLNVGNQEHSADIPDLSPASTPSNHTVREFDSGGQFIAFPEEQAPLRWKLLESIPRILSQPNEPLGSSFAKLLHTEHLRVQSDLEEQAIGIQPIPKRPQLLIDFNEGFLAPGFLDQGIELPSGAIWRPSVWAFGQSRSAVQYIDNSRTVDPVAEFSNRLDLFAQVNLSGTERIVMGLRPFDEEELTRREFSGYDFNNGNSVDALNAEFQTLFFEGDFGELFPGLDPYDSRLLDYGFSVGRMPLLAQQGLLLNEDMMDAVTITRNTLNGRGNLNLRATGVYSWNRINRSSSTAPAASLLDPSSEMIALLTESDFYHNTVNLDVAYVYGDEQFGDMIAFGISGIRRIHGYHNTYNTSLHLLGSFPTEEAGAFAEQGELLFAQTSWTPHHTEDLIYLNAFLAIDQFTSPARGPLTGSPLGQTGILFAHPGLGTTGPPLGVRTNNTAGAILGYQFFFEHTRRQLIWEMGGFKEFEGPENRGAIGTILRYQQAFGQHHILVFDGYAGKREALNVSPGARAEILVKF